MFNFPLANPFSANVPMTPRLVADFEAGFLYVNIHSVNSPEGEIRGQLVAGADITGETIPTVAQWLAVLFAIALLGLGWWRLR